MERGGPSRQTPKGSLRSPPETAKKDRRPTTPPGKVRADPETPETEKIPYAAPRRPVNIYAPTNPDEEAVVFEQRPGDTGVHSGDEYLPDRPEEEDETSDEEESSDEEEMSDLVFDGKAGTLDDILTHCTVNFLAKPRKYPDDKTKCGFLASKFRGQALTWLTKNVKEDATLLDKYSTLRTRLIQDFSLSDETKQLAADKKLKTLTQKGAAQSFAIEFDNLTDTLEYKDEAKCNAFLTRLKPEVRRQLIGNETTTYKDLRAKAISIDEQLFALRNPRQKRAKGTSERPRKPDKN